MDGMLVRVCHQHEHLGLQINNRLSWSDHVDEPYTAWAQKIGLLCSLWKRVSNKCLTKVCIGYIGPCLDYACAILRVESVHKQCHLPGTSTLAGEQL